MAEILTHQVFAGFNTEWLGPGGPGPSSSYVDACFPLHNPDWNKSFLKLWLRNPSVFVALFVRQGLPSYVDIFSSPAHVMCAGVL